MRRATANDCDHPTDRIGSTVGVRDIHRTDGTLLFIADDCLRTHQEPLIEAYPGDHGCLRWLPQQHEHGQPLLRVPALSEDSPAKLSRQLVENFPPPSSRSTEEPTELSTILSADPVRRQPN